MADAATPAPPAEIEKAEARREDLLELAEVFVMGPYMVWTARGVKHKYFRAGLTLIGLGTIAFTGLTLYRRWQRRKAEQGLGAIPYSPVVGKRRRLAYIPAQRW